MMHRTRYGARIFLIASFVASFPVITLCQTLKTFHHRPTGISVMVPSGYSATSESLNKERDVTIKLKSKNSIANYCDLSFTRTTVPDKLAGDASRRTLHERYRITESDEQTGCIYCDRTQWFINGKPLSPTTTPIQTKMLKMQLRAMFKYISVTCSSKADEYDKHRSIFEAVIKSIDIPY